MILRINSCHVLELTNQLLKLDSEPLCAIVALLWIGPNQIHHLVSLLEWHCDVAQVQHAIGLERNTVSVDHALSGLSK